MGYQLLQLLGKLMPVLRGVQTGVVAQINGGVAQGGSQHGTVVHRVGVTCCDAPLQVIHAQAMDEHQHLARGFGHRRHGIPHQGLALITHRHGRGQRVVAGGQPVAHHPVERGQHRLALWRLGRFVYQGGEQGLQFPQAGRQAFAHHVGDAVHCAVDKAGQAAGLSRGAARYTHGAPHRLVHAFGHVRHAAGGLGGQLRDRAQVRGTQMLCHA